MSVEQAERLARALLFEGYALYPYRASSLKNQQRWPLGALYPKPFCERGQGDAHRLQSECLVTGDGASVHISVRSLQLLERESEQGAWSEAFEHRVDSEDLPLDVLARSPSTITHRVVQQRLTDERGAWLQHALDTQLTMTATQLAPELWKLSLVVENLTPLDAQADRNSALQRCMISTHAILRATHGRFVSLLEPSPEHERWVAGCENKGSWPVLIGETTDDIVLVSPVILYDRPKIAPESPGDFFDATEIDEMLTLRLLTLSESERAEIMRGDPRIRRLLERTEALSEEQLAALHGARREPELSRRSGFAPGQRVRLRPRKGGDVFDIALAGEIATIATIEEDFEGRVYYTVTVDADPGRDLGLSGQPGHRFFFGAEELERLES